MVKNLKKLRMEYNISQQQLADVLGVSQQSINKYENHRVEPDIQMLCRMADYFQTTVDYLIGHGERRPEREEADFPEAALSLRGLTDSEREILRLLLLEFRKRHIGRREEPAAKQN